MRRMRYVGSGLLVLLLAACSGLQPQRLSQRMAVPGVRGEHPVYAQLRETTAGWRFAQLSDQPMAAGIQLGPMQAVLPAQTKPAVRGILGLAATRQRSSLDPLRGPLQGFRVEPLTMLGMYTVGLLVVVPGTIAGPLFVLANDDARYWAWVLPLYGDFGPREHAYEKAVASASAADHLRTDWGGLQVRYDHYLHTRQLMNTQAQDRLAVLRQRLQQIDSAREQRLRALLPQVLPLHFDNQSGWPAPDEGLLAQHLTIKRVLPLQHPPLQLDLSWPTLFPAATVDDFRQHLQRAEATAAQAPSEIDQQDRAQTQVVNAEAARADQNSGIIEIDSDAFETPLAGWQYLLPTIPGGSLMLQAGQVSNLPCYCVVLKARQFFHVLPQGFQAQDGHLQVSWQGRSVLLKNIGAAPLEMETLQVAEDHTAASVDAATLAQVGDLLPGQVQRVELPASFDGNSYTVSHDQAQTILVNLSLAVRYHEEGQALTYQLKEERSPALLDLLPAQP